MSTGKERALRTRHISLYGVRGASWLSTCAPARGVRTARDVWATRVLTAKLHTSDNAGEWALTSPRLHRTLGRAKRADVWRARCDTHRGITRPPIRHKATALHSKPTGSKPTGKLIMHLSSSRITTNISLRWCIKLVPTSPCPSWGLRCTRWSRMRRVNVQTLNGASLLGLGLRRVAWVLCTSKLLLLRAASCALVVS